MVKECIVRPHDERTARRRQGHCRRRAAHGALAAIVALTALAVCAHPASAAPGDVVWHRLSQRISGGTEAYRSLAVTSAGDAYAAGLTTSRAGAPPDVLLAKYGLGGRLMWRRVWTYPGRSVDVATDVVRDQRGGVIVAGSSGPCWLLLKYRADGYLEWVRRGRGSYASCGLEAVTVDSAGNIYATGHATSAGKATRIFTIRYSSKGSFRWRTTLGSTLGDAAGADVVSGGGNLYVVGDIAAGAGARACATIQYSSGGERRWLKTYAAGPATSAVGLVVAYRSGPLVMGSVTADGMPGDGFVARYSTSGVEQWVAGYTGPYDLGERFSDMVLDGSGRAVVTGTRQTGTAEEMVTVGFTPDGSVDWELTGGATEGSAVCRAGSGALYSVGGGATLFAGRATPAGVAEWQSSFTPADCTGFVAAAIRMAGTKALYVAGSTRPSAGGEAALLLRYRP